MKIAKLAEMTADELQREESNLEERIFRLRFQIGTGNIENPSKLGETKRDLARVKTLLRERELKLSVVRKGGEPESEAPAGKTGGKKKTGGKRAGKPAGKSAGASSEAK